MQDSKTQPHDGDRNSPFETAGNLPNAPGTKRPINRVLIACIVIGVAFILYLLAARTVTVSSNAEGFLVDDNSLMGFNLGDRLLLLPGLHTLRVSAPGYTPRDITVDLNDDKNTLVNVELQPLPGQLQINSNVDAQVYVDDELVGNSNTTLTDIAAGTHLLRITATHYKPFEQTIAIEGRHKTQSLDVTMQPDWITQEVVSTPAGAEVFVDQQSVGFTPTTITLPRGPRQLQVELAGHRTWQQILTIDPDQPFTLPAIELLPALVTLEITSSPSGAQITVDGLFQGETPLRSELAPAASATVVLIKDGYRAQEREVSLESDSKLHVDMAATLGRINLNVTPGGAKVTVNGRQHQGTKDKKSNRYSLQLPTHPHTLVVSAPGYKSKQLKLTPRAELAQHLNVSLLTLEQARWASTPDLLQSPTGQELKIFKPETTFTMGATRREQGRRANETQYQVRLNRPFYLATKPVTNEDFRRFQRFHSSGNIKGKSLNGEQQPVVNISWLQAAQFCNWLSQQEGLQPVYSLAGEQLQSVNMNSNGYRLPTEAEWAWAARHHDSTMKTYPWGSNRVSPPAQSANYADTQTLGLIGKALPGYEDSDLVTAAVGSYSPNQKGLYDLAGNVSEWIHDYYGIKTGLSLKAVLNPVGPASGDGHVIRGSNWKSASLSELRLAYRDSGSGKQDHVGFRVARYVFEEQ